MFQEIVCVCKKSAPVFYTVWLQLNHSDVIVQVNMEGFNGSRALRRDRSTYCSSKADHTCVYGELQASRLKRSVTT